MAKAGAITVWGSASLMVVCLLIAGCHEETPVESQKGWPKRPESNACTRCNEACDPILCRCVDVCYCDVENKTCRQGVVKGGVLRPTPDQNDPRRKKAKLRIDLPPPAEFINRTSRSQRLIHPFPISDAEHEAFESRLKINQRLGLVWWPCEGINHRGWVCECQPCECETCGCGK